MAMCGRAADKLTWEEIVALYRLTLDQPAVNARARYNVCPTTTVDTIVAPDDKRELVRMRCGLIPSWWSKPLKEMKLATFNARAETVATKLMFRSAFKRNRCLIPVSGYYEWQDTPGGKQPWYLPRAMAHRYSRSSESMVTKSGSGKNSALRQLRRLTPMLWRRLSMATVVSARLSKVRPRAR
jgi:putative SOS response-associated peptidase YedK